MARHVLDAAAIFVIFCLPGLSIGLADVLAVRMFLNGHIVFPALLGTACLLIQGYMLYVTLTEDWIAFLLTWIIIAIGVAIGLGITFVL